MSNFLFTALKGFPDVDFLISSIVKIPRKISTRHSEQGISNILLLKHVLKMTKPLRIALEPGINILFSTVLKILSDTKLSFIEERINQVINEDISYQKNTLAMRNLRCYAVKAGFNGLLDVARQTYKEATNDVYELVNTYKEKHEIELKINFSHSMGFFLSVQADQLLENELPHIFINVTRKKKLLVFTSMELLKWNERISNSLTEVYLMSDKIITELTSEICTHISILYKVAESIALVDMMMSFAFMCTISNYVRPEFTDTLGIKKGRHPIQDSISLNETISNDCYAADGKNFQIITGPNMSGKSTYLKQIALLTIMAQMGSYIPAEYASLRLTDKLFSRICNDNFMQANMSSFMTEMTEMSYIIRNVTNHSLIIIDELGRGISYAISEYLLRTKAFVFFATHFQELAIGLDIYPNVINLNLAVQTEDDTFKYLHKVKNGFSPVKTYGIKLASLVRLPQDLLDSARAISNECQQDDQEIKTKDRRCKKLMTQLVHQLVQSKRTSTLSFEELSDYLQSLQAKCSPWFQDWTETKENDNNEML
ncbi:MutS protein msh4 [Basidiobolus ranarum]|uniref:MutS protein msh4 n=1 Tax=Basidiobolus ranarum TaxID=34480 RepID=A0ABR2WMX6_9FUNG